MKILLINPGIYDRDRHLIKQRKIWLPGLTLPHLAALTPSDMDVEIIDEIINDVPEDGDWDLVGLSSMGTGIVRAWELGDHFKSKGIPVVLGGIAASLGGVEQNLSHCDALVIGESENVWLQLLRDVEHKRLKRLYHGPPADLGDFPIPRYDLFDKKKIGICLPLQATRGCKNQCQFCSVASFHNGRFRRRPLNQIARDVEVIKNMGFNKIAIIDDSIGIDQEFLKELCHLLISYNVQWMSQCTINIANNNHLLSLMAKSGCTMLSIGLESLNQNNLNSIKKHFNNAEKFRTAIFKIRQYGIDVSTEMMIGLDEDNDEVFETIYKFVMETCISVPRIFIVTPIPGTPLYEEWNTQGRIFDYDYINYTGSKLVFYPKGMTKETFEHNYWQLYTRLFSIPAIFKRFLGSRPTRGNLMNLFFLMANFHYRKHIKRKIPPGIV